MPLIYENLEITIHKVVVFFFLLIIYLQASAINYAVTINMKFFTGFQKFWTLTLFISNLTRISRNTLFYDSTIRVNFLQLLQTDRTTTSKFIFSSI